MIQTRNKRKVDNLIALSLSLALVITILTGRIDYTDSDPFLSMYTAQRVIQDFRLDLDPYTQLHQHAMIRSYNNHYFDYFPPGSAIFSSPLYLLHTLAGIDMDNHQQVRRAQKRIAALVNAISIILAFFLARCWLAALPAGIVTVIFFFGTPLMSTMGTALWNMNFTVLWMLSGLLIIARSITGAVSYTKMQLMLLGFSLFAAFLCRPTAALYVVFVSAVLLMHDRRAFMWVMSGAAVLFVLFLLVSQKTYSTLLPPYYLPSRLETNTFGEALYGNLFSPSRGLFPFIPFLFVIIFWLLQYAKNIHRTLLTGLVLWIVIHLLLISQFPHWWGGGSYGPRLLTDTMPAWFLLSIMSYHFVGQKQRWIQSIFLMLGAFSIYIHTIQGMYNPYAYEWNVTPNIDKHHQQIFDWKYPQFLHNAERHTERYQQYLQKNGLQPKLDFSVKDLYSTIAEIEKQELIVDHQQGYVFYGPYEAVLPGLYRFEIPYQYSGGVKINENLGQWDIVLHQHGKTIKLANGIWQNKQQLLTGTFVVDPQYSLAALEIRPYFSGAGKVTIRGLKIEQIQANE